MARICAAPHQYRSKAMTPVYDTISGFKFASNTYEKYLCTKRFIIIRK